MRLLLLALALVPLAGCGRSDAPPPLTGNLTDARGAHAGSFRTPDAAAPGDYGNAAAPLREVRGSPVENVAPANGSARR